MEIKEYVTRDGRAPFSEWINRLKDERGRERILMRIDRLAIGLRGDWKSVTGSVSELRIDTGPGYRLYFVQEGIKYVLLLCGGDKSRQQADIRRAHEYWEDHKARSIQSPISRR
jgi:putative addiction module killer protein